MAVRDPSAGAGSASRIGVQFISREFNAGTVVRLYPGRAGIKTRPTYQSVFGFADGPGQFNGGS